MASTFDTGTIGDTPGNEDELDTSAELTTERAKPQSSHWGHAPNSADPVRDHLSHLQHDMQASDMPPRVPWDSTIAEAAHRLRVTQVIAEIRPELIADEFNEEHFAREWPIYAPTSFGLNYLLDTYGLSEAHITDTRVAEIDSTFLKTLGYPDMRHREAFSHITMSVKEGIIRTAVATAGVQIRESPTIDTPSPDVCFLCQTGKIQSPMHLVCALCDNHLTSDDALTQDLSFRAIPDKSGSKLQAWADGRPVALPTSVLTASAYTPVSNHDIASIGLDLAIIAGGSRTEAQRGIPARSALLLDIISYAENAAELCEIRVCTSTKKLMPEVEAAFRARRQMLGPPPTRIGLHSIESCLNAAAEVIKRGERSLPSIAVAAL